MVSRVLSGKCVCRVTSRDAAYNERHVECAAVHGPTATYLPKDFLDLASVRRINPSPGLTLAEWRGIRNAQINSRSTLYQRLKKSNGAEPSFPLGADDDDAERASLKEDYKTLRRKRLRIARASTCAALIICHYHKHSTAQTGQA